MTTNYPERKAIWLQFGFTDLNDEEFKKRTTAVQLAIFTAVAGSIYSLIYFSLGLHYLPIVVYAYILVCLLNVLFLRFSHRYTVFGVIQLILICIFPVSAQLTIGGYVNASGVVLAAFLAPAGALLYASRTAARFSFYLFILIVAGSALWEYYYVSPSPRLSRGVILVFFPAVFIAVCGIIYFLLESFLQKQLELREELRQSITTLQATQNQLIQKEKMASLGELMAGIAHEIQNPLNFVNNFSELVIEQLDELREDVQASAGDETGALIDLLRDNLQKIHHNGDRASSIVRSMLEHSRTGAGETQLTDLNTLIDEYLKIAYHGQRAQNNAFNCLLVKDLDPLLVSLPVMTQDISRVLLNLLNNAFYAVHQRTRTDTSLVPTVWVSTHLHRTEVLIRVRDNGPGIPASIRDKIFQPFFTTKPTGEGTGLGLSLSYDIITKGHNGRLTVASTQGQGTEFTIALPRPT